MTQSSRFATRSDRWANELWNVSLLPVPAANESGSFPARQTPENAPPRAPELRKLENLDERRSELPPTRPLRVSYVPVSGNLE
jgi:hypothetical protein